MSRKLWTIAAATILMLLVVILIAKKVHFVDPKPAVALGNSYFSKLKQGQIGDALAMYSDEFRQQRGDDWRKLLSALNARYGAVINFTLLEEKTVPVAEVPCVMLHYQISRTTLVSEEKVTICPGQINSRLAIAGHDMTRLDTGQSIAAGITSREKVFFSTGIAKPTIETRTPEAVRNAANEFYNQMSTDDYDAIYTNSSEDFRSSITRDNFLSFLKKANQVTGGGCKSANLAKMTVVPGETADLMYVSYDRICRNGSIRDGMSLTLANAKALFAGYFLNRQTTKDLPVINEDEPMDSAILANEAMLSNGSFYQDLAAQRYDAIIELATEQWRTPEKRQMLSGFLRQVNERAGACGSPTPRDTSYTTSTAGMFVELSFERQCGNSKITDKFTWKVVKGEALLDGYYVDGFSN